MNRKSSVEGSNGSTTFNSGSSNAERIIKHINALLADVPAVAHWLPLTLEGPDNAFFEVSRDGILLAELINVLLPGYIRIDKIHRDFSNAVRCHFLKLENHTMVLRACQKFGCRIVNLGPCDLASGKSYLILGIVWQIIKRGMVERIKMNIGGNVILPGQESNKLVKSGKEEPNDVAAEEEDVEALILKMVNEQAEQNSLEKVENLSEDLADGKVIAQLLLNAGCEMDQCEEIVHANSMVRRADAIVAAGQQVLGPLCIIESGDFVKGNQQMMVLFLAALLKKAAEDRVGHIDYDSGYYNDGPIIELDTSDLDATISRLKAENATLKKENEALSDQLVTMQADLDLARNPQANADSLAEQLAALAVDSGEKTDEKIYRDNKATALYIPTDENAFRLRQIYLHTTNVTNIVTYIYGALTVANLQIEKNAFSRIPIITGHLRKKDWDAHKWRRRFFILRDNFLFSFPEDAGPKETPIDVLRVDDALVRVMFELKHMEDPVISVEIASKVNPFYLYLSADAIALYKWKEAITRASAYWLLTR